MHGPDATSATHPSYSIHIVRLPPPAVARQARVSAAAPCEQAHHGPAVGAHLPLEGGPQHAEPQLLALLGVAVYSDSQVLQWSKSTVVTAF